MDTTKKGIQTVLNLLTGKRIGKETAITMLTAMMVGAAEAAPILSEPPSTAHEKGPQMAKKAKEGPSKGKGKGKKAKAKGKGKRKAKAYPFTRAGVEAVLKDRFSHVYDPAKFLDTKTGQGRFITESMTYTPKRLSKTISRLVGGTVRLKGFSSKEEKFITRLYLSGKRVK